MILASKLRFLTYCLVNPTIIFINKAFYLMKQHTGGI